MRMPRHTRVAVASLLLSGAVLVPSAPALAAAPGTARPAAVSVAADAVPFTAAQAHRQSDGSFTLAWSSPAAQVTVTASTDPAATTGVAVGGGAGTGSLTVPAGTLDAGSRWYFRLAPDTGTALTVADRSLGLADAGNFRDVGGYRTADGHWVRMGVVYRSGKLSALDAAEQQTLLGQHIGRDIDLRNSVERAQDPDVIPAGIAYQVADVLSLDHGIHFHQDPVEFLAEALAAGLFSGSPDLSQSVGYPFMVNFTGSDYAFHDVLTAIAAQPDATVYHCTAGKDRTGWTTAVLLTLLGVDQATVEADYLASNAYTGDPNAVDVSWLRAAFSEVHSIYGSFDAYLHQGLNLDDATIAALRAKLLV